MIYFSYSFFLNSSDFNPAAFIENIKELSKPRIITIPFTNPLNKLGTYKLIEFCKKKQVFFAVIHYLQMSLFFSMQISINGCLLQIYSFILICIYILFCAHSCHSELASEQLFKLVTSHHLVVFKTISKSSYIHVLVSLSEH